jgi:hypothetical protein
LSQEEGKYAPGHPALQSEAIRALKEQVARAKIEVARRREEIAGSVGGRRLEEFNAELGRLAIDRAEKEAQGTVLHQQLDRVEQQMARAALFDPEAARARLGREMLDILARRVAELQMRLANLQPPVVTVIGAN